MTTLFEHAGGEVGLRALSDAFYRRVLVDPVLLPLFKDPSAPHAERLALYLIENFGGPPLHSRARGGFPVVVRSHLELDVSEAQRARWVEHMFAACDELKMSELFMDTFRRYVDFVSRRVLVSSRRP